jgi:hypothetical protein
MSISHASSAQTVRFHSEHGTLAISRPAPTVVVVTFTGSDVGQFGQAPFAQIAAHLTPGQPIELYIDAGRGTGASLDVSGDWARWLHANRSSFRHVSMLTGSRFIQISADFVRRFAGMDALMRLYAEPAAFESALASSIASASPPA